MSKFLLSVMMGASAVLATNTTACVETNTTSCSTTAAPTADSNTTNTATVFTFTADFTLGMTLPSNVTVTTVGAAVPTEGKSVGEATSTTETGAAKVVFDIAYSTQSAVRKAVGDEAATATVTAIGASRRRSLGEKSRRLTGDSLKVTYDASFASEDKRNAAAVAVESATDAFQSEFATKMGEAGTYGDIAVTGMSVTAVAGGTCADVAACKLAATSVADDSSSGAATTFLSAAAAMVLAAFAF